MNITLKWTQHRTIIKIWSDLFVKVFSNTSFPINWFYMISWSKSLDSNNITLNYKIPFGLSSNFDEQSKILRPMIHCNFSQTTTWKTKRNSQVWSANWVMITQAISHILHQNDGDIEVMSFMRLLSWRNMTVLPTSFDFLHKSIMVSFSYCKWDEQCALISFAPTLKLH